MVPIPDTDFLYDCFPNSFKDLHIVHPNWFQVYFKSYYQIMSPGWPNYLIYNIFIIYVIYNKYIGR